MTTQTMKFHAPAATTPGFGRMLAKHLVSTLEAFAQGLAAARTYETLRNRGTDPQAAVTLVFERHFANR